MTRLLVFSALLLAAPLAHAQLPLGHPPIDEPRELVPSHPSDGDYVDRWLPAEPQAFVAGKVSAISGYTATFQPYGLPGEELTVLLAPDLLVLQGETAMSTAMLQPGTNALAALRVLPDGSVVAIGVELLDQEQARTITRHVQEIERGLEPVQ